MAARPTHPLFKKTRYWEINKDGSDRILIDLLSRKNSLFPAHTNWERMRILYLKHDRTHGEKWWLTHYHKYTLPDYTNIYGVCNWDYMDNDPDWAMPVNRNNDANLAIWASSVDGFGLLVYDDCDRFKAKRVAKISIFKPEYLPYTPNDYTCMKSLWRVDGSQKAQLVEILKKPWDSSDSQYANWDRALGWIDMNGAICACDENGKPITSINNLPRDMPMPDYTKLPN